MSRDGYYTEQFDVEDQGIGSAFSVAMASAKGQKTVNEDYVCFQGGRREHIPTKGSIMVMADGISGGQGGRVAAETFCRSVCDAYYGLPEVMSPDRAIYRALDSINEWMYQIGKTDQRLSRMSATFCIIIIRGWEGFIFHAGDIRCYLLKNNTLSQLTRDHLIKAGIGAYIERAAGLSETIRVDLHKFIVEEGDLIFACSDGYYKYASRDEIARSLTELLHKRVSHKQLIDKVIARGSKDDVTLGSICMKSIPKKEFSFFEACVCGTPILPPPAIGAVVDGLRVLKKINDNWYSQLFLVQRTDGKPDEFVMKVPKRNVFSDDNIRRSFSIGWWVSSQVSSPWIAEVVLSDVRSQSQLYTLMPFYKGCTLEERIKQGEIDISEGLAIAEKLAKAIYELHRLRIIHRDIKPENVFLLDNGELKLIDFGFAYAPGILDLKPDVAPGTLAYMAPEYKDGFMGDARSDVYSFGVTLYRLFCGGKWPFGVRGYVDLIDRRPQVPLWLSSMIGKMMSVAASDRYVDTMEVAFIIQKNMVFMDSETIKRNRVKRPVSEVVLLRVAVIALIIIVMIMTIGR